MDNTLIIDAVRAALERGGQHILIAPDGGVSIWPDDCAYITHCKDCRKWIDMIYMDGMIKACELTEMATKPNDFCSYAEAIDND